MVESDEGDSDNILLVGAHLMCCPLVPHSGCASH